jgi:hypothetical protein
MAKETSGESAKAPEPEKEKVKPEIPASDPMALRNMADNMASHEGKGYTGAALFGFGGVVVLVGALWAVIASATGGAALSYGPLILLGVGGAVMSVTGLTRMREGEVASQLRLALLLTAERAERLARRAAEAKQKPEEPAEPAKGRPRPKAKGRKEAEAEDFERGIAHAALTEDQMLIKSYHLRELHKALLARISDAEAALMDGEQVAFVLVAETLKMHTQVLLFTSTRMAVITDNRVDWTYLKDVKDALARWKPNAPQCEFSLTVDGKQLEWANVEPEAAAFRLAKALDEGTLPLPARPHAAEPSPIVARTPGKYMRGTLTAPDSGAPMAELAAVEVVLTANQMIHLVCGGERILSVPASDDGVRLDAAAIIASELQAGPLAESMAAKTLVGPLGLRGMPREEPADGKPLLVLLFSIDDACALILMGDQGGAERIQAATRLPPPQAAAPASAAIPENEDMGAVAAAIMAAVAAENSAVVAPSTSLPGQPGEAPAVSSPVDVPQATDTGAVIREIERVQKLHADGVLTDDELRNLTRRLVADDGAA